MARIPPTRFGNAVADPVGSGNVVVNAPSVQIPLAAFDTGLGEQVSRAGNILAIQGTREADEARRKLEAEEERKRREADAQAKRDAEQARRNAAAAAFARYQVETDAVTDTMIEDLGSGKVSREAFGTAHQKALKDAKKANLESLPPDMQAAMQDNLILADGRLANRVRDAVRKSARDERVAGFNGTVEALSRLALTDPARARAQAASLFASEGKELLGQEGARKGLNAFNESASATFLTEQMNRARGSYNALRNVSKLIDADQSLDPAKKVALNGQIQAQLVSLEHRAEINATRREREARGAIDGLATVLTAGRQPDPEYLQSVAAKVKGTPYEAAVAGLMKEAPKTVGFASQPVATQQAALQGLLQQMNTKGSTPEVEAQYRKLEQTHKATIADIKADPWNAAAERNVIPTAPPLELDIANLDQAFGARSALLPMLETWTGRKESPLRPEEAQTLARLLSEQPVETRSRMLAAIGQQVGDPGRLRALAEQMGKGNTEVATAAWLAASGQETSKGRPLSELYLRGAEALRTKTARLDERAEVGVRATIYKAIEGAYNSPQATDAAADVALKVYATLKAEGSDDVSRAIRLATGGIYEGRGWKVPKPYGWTDSQFRDSVRAVTPLQVQEASGNQGIRAGPVPLSVLTVSQQLPNMRLRATSQPGEYAMQMGANLVTRDDGMPLVIRLELQP